MRNTKRRVEYLSFYDHTGMEKHLEKMALNGWMIEKIGNYGWIYRKSDPKKLHFTISYYPKASVFDPEPSDAQMTFHEFCAHTGWVLACAFGQMQVFYNERENPIPIETDPVIEIQTLHAACKRNFLPAHFMLLALSIFGGFLFVSSLLGHPISLLSSPSDLFTGLCWVLLFILCTTELLGYYIWRKKAMKAAEQGIFLDTPNTTGVQKAIIAVLLIGVIYLAINYALVGDNLMRWIVVLMAVYMIALHVLVNGTKELLKKKKASTGVNRTVTLIMSFVLSFAMMGAITFGTLKLSQEGFFAEEEDETYEHGGMTWVAYQDEIPLTVEDLLDVEYDGYMHERRGDESILIGMYEMNQRPRFDAEDYVDMPTLEYSVVIPKFSFLYDLCKKEMYNDLDETGDDEIPEGYKAYLMAQDPSAWGAVEVYRQFNQSHGEPSDRYLLCYEDRIVEIRFDWEVTEAQMAIVTEKLSN